MRFSNRRRRGNALLEFALVSVFIVPLLLGMFVTGFKLGECVQVIQVTRDTAHMYAMQVDFSTTANKAIVVQLAQGLGMTATGGNGVVLLSEVEYIGAAQCTAAGYNSTTCKNMNQNVLLQRIVIGNSATAASQFGTPNSNIWNSSTGIVSNYYTDTSARATNFGNLLTLNAGSVAYVVEGNFATPNLSAFSSQANGVIYNVAIF